MRGRDSHALAILRQPLTRRHLLATAPGVAASILLGSCAARNSEQQSSKRDLSRYLTFLDEEPRSADPQCISENYTVVLNVFDRLVEVDEDDKSNALMPSLAESWEESRDGLTYIFKLREGVSFSDGEPLTSTDVGFTLRRLLTHPQSCNSDIAIAIKGAKELHEGRANDLAGFMALDDYRFAIVLEHPFAAFMAGLSTPGASILSEKSTTRFGEAFGASPKATIGTGPFVLSEWRKHKEIVMDANPACWAGPPRCSGLRMRFYTEDDPLCQMYEDGEIDILDLDKLAQPDRAAA